MSAPEKVYPINPVLLAGRERYEKRWYSLLQDFKVTDATNATKWWNHIVATYAGQKNRAFHNEDWLWSALNVYEDLTWTNNTWDDECAQIAIWFVRANINPNLDRFHQRFECIQMMTQCMNDLGIDGEDIKSAVRYIANYEAACDEQSYWAYHDSLRWWWGRTPITYNHSITDLQDENSHLDDLEFIEWRVPMLEKALKETYLFRTERYRMSYEVQAQLNLSSELMDYKRVLSGLSTTS